MSTNTKVKCILIDLMVFLFVGGLKTLLPQGDKGPTGSLIVVSSLQFMEAFARSSEQ